MHEAGIVREEDRGDEIAELASRIDAAQHRLLTLIREFDEKEHYWIHYGATSCAHWLTWRLGMSPATAREKVRVARALGRLPTIDAAFGRGEIGYSKVRAITRIATKENESILLDYARHGTGAALEKICRMYRKWVEPQVDGIERESECERYVTSYAVDCGVDRIVIQLPSDEASLVLQALDSVRFLGNREAWSRRRALRKHTVQEAGLSPPISDGRSADRSREAGGEKESRDPIAATVGRSAFDRADALVALASSALEAGAIKLPASSHRFEVVVNVDAATLRNESETLATLEPGGTAPAEMARRIACDAAIVEVEVDERGEALDVGRRRRSIPPSIRRALRRRDKGCRFPSCTNTRFVDGHHIVHWADGGETKLGNLVLLCRRHHRLVHEEGFRVEMRRDGPRFFTPEGEELPEVFRAASSEQPSRYDGFLSWLEESGVEEEREGYPLPDTWGWDLDLAVQGLALAAERTMGGESASPLV